MNYDFEAKQKGYRVPAWVFVERMCSVPRRLRRVAVLDTAQGLEVRHLVDIGYSPENILAVNYSAAQLAAMTKALRADGIEGVQTKAGDYVEVLMKWGGRLDVIGFDTTSNLRAKSFQSLGEIVKRHSPNCVVEVMLAGRESGGIAWHASAGNPYRITRRSSLNQELNPSHHARVILALQALVAPGLSAPCHSHVTAYRWAMYMSTSGQPMVWVVAGITPHQRDGRPGKAIASGCLTCIDGRSTLAVERRRDEIEAELGVIRARIAARVDETKEETR